MQNTINTFIVLRGQIKGFNHSTTTILFEVGSYRTVVGKFKNARVYSYRILDH